MALILGMAATAYAEDEAPAQPDPDDWQVRTIATPVSGVVPSFVSAANGLLANVTFDASGVAAGNWDLVLADPDGVPTDFAGRHADIVGVNPKVAEGRISAAAMQDATAERTLEKVRWVKEAAAKAGRDVNALEWNALVFVAAVTDDPRPLREALAKNGSMTVEQVAACPLYLTGPASEIRDVLQQRREAFGISYVVIQGADEKALSSFAEQVLAPLAGK